MNIRNYVYHLINFIVNSQHSFTNWYGFFFTEKNSFKFLYLRFLIYRFKFLIIIKILYSTIKNVFIDSAAPKFDAKIYIRGEIESHIYNGFNNEFSIHCNSILIIFYFSVDEISCENKRCDELVKSPAVNIPMLRLASDTDSVFLSPTEGPHRLVL